jgi:hypothetical protein
VQRVKNILYVYLLTKYIKYNVWRLAVRKDLLRCTFSKTKYELDAVFAVVCVFQEELISRLHNFLLTLDGSMLGLTMLHFSAGLKMTV